MCILSVFPKKEQETPGYFASEDTLQPITEVNNNPTPNNVMSKKKG